MIQDQDERYVGDKDARLECLTTLHERLQTIIEERAAAYADDPIGRFGLHDLRYRIRGNRENPVLVEEWRMDHGLLRAMRRIEKQAAIEMGQWGQKQDPERGKISTLELIRMINSGRDRAAAEKKIREAANGGAQPDG